MTAAKNNWHNGYVPPTQGPTTTTTRDPNATTQSTNAPTTQSTTQGTTRPTTQPPSGTCNEGIFYTDANDCGVYYHCNHGSLVSQKIIGRAKSSYRLLNIFKFLKINASIKYYICRIQNFFRQF